MPKLAPEYELVGISGTFGGAVSALAAWQGLYVDAPGGVTERLDAVWSAITASSPPDRLLNEWTKWWTTMGERGVPLPELSPYDVPAALWAQRRLRELIETQIDLRRCQQEMTAERPRLVVGAVNVSDGEFETFVNEEITADAVLASAAIPTLFPAVEIDSNIYWDGLFSQNPPVYDLTVVPPEHKPEELWIIQINPQEREGPFRSLEDIGDRRNELSGNLSLNQELRYIALVNEWIDAGYLPDERFNRITVRRLKLNRKDSFPSKLDRSPAFIRDLLEEGKRQAEAFLTDVREEPTD